MKTSPKEPLVLAAIAVIALVLSGIKPYDRLTWVMEVLPVLIAIPLLIGTYKHFPLTPLL
jgi:putative membrane protein